jgi:hypothetical protein
LGDPILKKPIVRMKEAQNVQAGRQINTSTGFIVEKWSCTWVSRKRTGARSCLQTGGRYGRWVEKSQEDHWTGKFSMAL